MYMGGLLAISHDDSTSIVTSYAGRPTLPWRSAALLPHMASKRSAPAATMQLARPVHRNIIRKQTG
jgi:hypothetical protein